MIEGLFESLNSGLAGSPLWALVAAALWGVASMLLSPCHLAGIPLIVGFIHGQGRANGRRAFALAGLFAIVILVTIAAIRAVTASCWSGSICSTCCHRPGPPRGVYRWRARGCLRH